VLGRWLQLLLPLLAPPAPLLLCSAVAAPIKAYRSATEVRGGPARDMPSAGLTVISLRKACSSSSVSPSEPLPLPPPPVLPREGLSLVLRSTNRPEPVRFFCQER
jgi:hypothetical protein